MVTTDADGERGWLLRSVLRVPLVTLVGVLILCTVCVAREKKKADDYALIFGTVWAADSTPYRGATIKIRRSDQKNAKWTLYSDSRGEFAQRVPPEPADYVVWAELPKRKGPAAEKKVHIEGNERVDIGLHLTQ